MTPKYWIKIVIGMMAIFVVGTLLWRGIDNGKAFFEDKISTVAGSVPSIMTSGFHLDNDQIGDVQRLQLMRSTPGQVDSAVLTVKIDDPADLQRIESCTVRVTGTHPFSSSTRFACTSRHDSARLNLVPIGHIQLLPDGKEVVLYVAGNALDNVRENAYRGAGRSDSGDVDITATDGNFSITINGKDVVRFSGDSNGGSLVVRDGNGNPIVEISGDSNGGSVQVTGKDGKKVVNIHGVGSGNTKPAHP